jgi:hypothetical protein
MRLHGRARTGYPSVGRMPDDWGPRRALGHLGFRLAPNGDWLRPDGTG